MAQRESAQHYFDSLEDAHTRMCFEEAAKNGHTIEEAELCDNGNVECRNCPFKHREYKSSLNELGDDPMDREYSGEIYFPNEDE